MVRTKRTINEEAQDKIKIIWKELSQNEIVGYNQSNGLILVTIFKNRSNGTSTVLYEGNSPVTFIDEVHASKFAKQLYHQGE